jgi:hypothetical protein
MGCRSLLDHALKTYSDRDSSHNSYIPEKVRALHFRSKALRAIGKVDEAEADLEEAEELLAQVVDHRTDLGAASLANPHFDEVVPVAFWSL